jgi:hypothetical protein
LSLGGGPDSPTTLTERGLKSLELAPDRLGADEELNRLADGSPSVDFGHSLNYLAMVKLAMVERCFRALFSDAA